MTDNIEELAKNLSPEDLQKILEIARSKSSSSDKDNKSSKIVKLPSAPKDGRLVTKPSISKGNKQAQLVPVNTTEPRPNYFEERFGNACKNDIVHDKKLWKEREPTIRNNEPPTFYEVECRECDKIFTVLEKQLKYDHEGGVIYTCEKCLTGFGPGGR